jgi:hypothetical protein
MVKKINHLHFFLDSFRTGLVFIAGILSYELLKIIESDWNKMYPNNEFSNLAHRKLFHFLIIFIVDLVMLYLVALSFNIHL